MKTIHLKVIFFSFFFFFVKVGMSAIKVDFKPIQLFFKSTLNKETSND